MDLKTILKLTLAFLPKTSQHTLPMIAIAVFMPQ